MKNKQLLCTLLILFALPTIAYASEREPYNPPGYIGATMFFLALILPMVVSFWLRNRKP